MARADREAPAQAVQMAFYIMAEMLERQGVLDQAQLADAMERVELGDKPVLLSNLRGMAETLRTRPFGPLALRVIEGGANDDG